MTTKEFTAAREINRKGRRVAAIGGLAVAVLTAAGYAAHRTDGAGPLLGRIDSVGRVDGAAALVAVVADGREVTAVVASTSSAIAEHFNGDLVGDTARMRTADGASMVVRIAGTGAHGVVTAPDGANATFTTTANTGLYTAAGATAEGTYDATWVVLGDGTQAGTLHERSGSLPAGTLAVRHEVDLGGKARGERRPTTIGDANLSGIGRVDATRVTPASLRSS
jgi:hypothetical protein